MTFDVRDLRHVGSGKLHKLLGDVPMHFVDEGDAITMFANAFATAVDLRLQSDVPVGVFLSGGLDSSLIMLTAHKLLGRSLPSFTISLPNADPAYDETDQARTIAGLCGSEHHVLPLDEVALLNAIPDQIAQMDQPLADAAIIPTALLSKFARQHVTVALGGEGGDELQGGYTRHMQEKALRALYALRGVAKPMLPLADRVGKNLPQWKRQSAKLQDFINTQADSAYEALMTLWPQENDINLSSGFRTADTEFYLPHNLLMKLDGATMQASLEGRCPYLDPELWATMDVIPRRFWRGKRLAKHMLQGLGGTVPNAKRGLTLPLAEWLRGGACAAGRKRNWRNSKR
jgi:asparagine synthase (glutamine-hydrolysing)